MLITKEVEIKVRYQQKRLKELGYEIPKEKIQLYYKGKKWGYKYIVPKDAVVTIKVEELSSGSSTKVLVQCDSCKKQYYLKYNNYIKQLHNGENYCADCANKVLFSGENNNSWNFNLSNEERQLKNEGYRHIIGYSDFVKNVLYRDNYKCVVCGNDEDLEVHHLDGYEWCKEKRTDINNGICLCKKCHKLFHFNYGNKGNTLQQFEEWIGKPLSQIINTNINLKVNQDANKVVCLETLQIYDSAYDCERQLLKKYRGKGLGSKIRNCCEKNHNGIYATSEYKHFVWYKDYIKMSKEEINNILSYKPYSQPKQRRKVICIETKQLFNSVTDAVIFFGGNKDNRSQIIKSAKSYMNIKLYPYTYKNYHWCYFDDYKGDLSELIEVGEINDK